MMKSTIKTTILALLSLPALALAATGNDNTTDLFASITPAGDVSITTITKGECPMASIALSRSLPVGDIQFAGLAAGVQTKKDGIWHKGENGPVVGNRCVGTISPAVLPADLRQGEYQMAVRVGAGPDVEVKMIVVANCDDDHVCQLVSTEK